MDRSALTVSLHAPDVAATVAFYTDVLGFEHTASWEENGTLFWAEVARPGPKGTARLWFFRNAIKPDDTPAMTGLVYLFVDDVDAEAARLDGAATIRWGPEDMPYGLRELGIEDLNGYLVVFAKDIDDV